MNGRHDTQQALRGVWRSPVDGCPHYHGNPDSVGRCDANEMRSCNLDCGYPCELFKEIIAEWQKELLICGECGEMRPGDERVLAGMKCAMCAYGGEIATERR